MKTFKLIGIAFLLVVLVCTMAACGGNTETGPVGETDENGEHVHTVREQIEEATCQAIGYKREICRVCGEQISETPLAIVDHIAALSEDCTVSLTCKFCGMAMETAEAHRYEVVIDNKPASLSAEGYIRSRCVLCKKESTETILAGAIDHYDDLPEGALTADVMTEGSLLASDYTFKVTEGAFEIVSENGNRYIKKIGPNGQIYYQSHRLNATKLEISFDFRLDQVNQNIRGLISLVNGGKEMRILNVSGTALGFGINSGGIVNFASLEVGRWTTVKIVVDAETFDYEIYINGEKYLYTTADPANEGMHLIYTLQEGELKQKTDGFSNKTIHNGADRSPFVPNGEEVTDVYFFHWSADLVCSLDSLTIRTERE